MMKILVGILVFVLATFLNSVELGTPLGTGFALRSGSAPKPVSGPGPSGRMQPGRGGRRERIQSGRITQPAEPSATAAAQPNPRHTFVETFLENTYIEDPQRGFISLEEAKAQGLKLRLLHCDNLILGIIEGEDIVPLFNKEHKIIRIDRQQNYLQIPMGKTVARGWGVFGTYADFSCTSSGVGSGQHTFPLFKRSTAEADDSSKASFRAHDEHEHDDDDDDDEDLGSKSTDSDNDNER
ncbi:uncharacterized protein LOC117178491 [Belonocnema kinseyi]|uniref:uncharacterized protein LOC117178491 n=1 Tax=Belonocnema kinseyi TaxID=2817044 RepID=UPI00143DF7B4|nr:uncharacterized protein LOC117178491 [Belonocnema kinseyi]